MILNNPKSDFQIFTFSECKDDLTSLFTSQSIAVVALSTAPVCRPRAPSGVTPILCHLAPHPPASHQLPLACQAASNREPGQACQLPGLALHLYQSPDSWPSPWTTCPKGSAAPPGAREMSIVPFQIKFSGSCKELCGGSENPWSHGVSGPFVVCEICALFFFVKLKFCNSLIFVRFASSLGDISVFMTFVFGIAV